MATTAGFTPSRHVSLCSSTRCIFFFFLRLRHASFLAVALQALLVACV